MKGTAIKEYIFEPLFLGEGEGVWRINGRRRKFCTQDIETM